MNFEYSEEQTLLRSSLERLIGDHYQPEQRAARRDEPPDVRRKRWALLAEMGVLALPFAEQDGGLGGGAVDIALVMETFGAGQVREPYLSSIVLAGGLIADQGSEAQKQALLPPLIAGEQWLALAHAERGAGFGLSGITTTARRDGAGFVLDGTKIAVLDGGVADGFIVVARTGGGTMDEAGLSGFYVPATAAGLEITRYGFADSSLAAELRLADLRLPETALLGREGGFFPALETAAARASVALCSEAVGIAGSLIETTLEHLRTRRQFGAPLGGFQAIQHRMADAYLGLELARSITLKAMLADPAADRGAWLRAAWGAKALVARTTVPIAEEAVQLHGAMGMTDELGVGQALGRLLVIATLFGDATALLDRYNSLSPAGEA